MVIFNLFHSQKQPLPHNICVYITGASQIHWGPQVEEHWTIWYLLWDGWPDITTLQIFSKVLCIACYTVFADPSFSFLLQVTFDKCPTKQNIEKEAILSIHGDIFNGTCLVDGSQHDAVVQRRSAVLSTSFIFPRGLMKMAWKWSFKGLHNSCTAKI